ncbi:hypothetical protein MCEZE4_00450 [Burkholderiaceae bacterium]
MNPILSFERVTGEKDQVSELYELLRKKKYPISHKVLPTFREHSQFVANNPYRAWYLIGLNKTYIGAVYILKNNCIGLSLTLQTQAILAECLSFILKKYKPLKEIKSFRAPHFHINISANDKKFASQLKKLGAIEMQTTYNIEPIFLKE